MLIKLLTVDENGLRLEPTPKEIIKKMRAEYDTQIRSVLTPILQRRRPEVSNIVDSKSAWVSRKELEALLDDNKANGLRIYYGCHHESTGGINPALDYFGRHNLILVATIDNVNLAAPTTENSLNQLKESSRPEEANSVIFPTGDGSFAGMGDDTLPLCPPRCPSVDDL